MGHLFTFIDGLITIVVDESDEKIICKIKMELESESINSRLCVPIKPTLFVFFPPINKPSSTATENDLNTK